MTLPGYVAHSQTASGRPSLEAERDLRVDFLRGLALLVIFIDHAAAGWLNPYTFNRLSFMDAAEVFFFLSGYVSGIVYSRVFFSSGFGVCYRKALRRCLQLYAAQTGLLLVCLGLYGASNLHSIDFKEGLMLKKEPLYLDILPAYIIFVGCIPIALRILEFRPILLGLLSAVLYFATQMNHLKPFELFAVKGHFNPFAWQAVFFAGLIAGYGKWRGLWKRWRPSRGLLLAAIGGLVAIALVRAVQSGLIHWQFFGIPVNHIPLTGKRDVAPLRLVNLGLWILVCSAVDPASQFFKSFLGRIPVVCGQSSLAVYWMGTVLTHLWRADFSYTSGNRVLKLLWILAGCMVLAVTPAIWKRIKSSARHAAGSFPFGRVHIVHASPCDIRFEAIPPHPEVQEGNL